MNYIVCLLLTHLQGMQILAHRKQKKLGPHKSKFTCWHTQINMLMVFSGLKVGILSI